MTNICDIVERLLEEEYWIIDILPKTVPASRGERFSALEKYFLDGDHKVEIQKKFVEILVKLNCYYDLLVNDPDRDDWKRNPDPEELFLSVSGALRNSGINIFLEGQDTLMSYYLCDTYMTIYNPSAAVKSLLQKLAAAYGLFFYQPAGGKKKEAEKQLKEWRIM